MDVGRRGEGGFPDKLGLELPFLAGKPTIEFAVFGALTLFQAL